MSSGIGVYTALALIIANTVGSGILTTSGYLARDVGNVSLIMALWAVGGFTALCGAHCYGALAREWPISGGDYVYIRSSYGSALAYLSGWTSLTLGFGAAIAASALGLAEYLAEALSGTLFEREPIKKLVALTSLGIVSVLHTHSIERSKYTQLWLTGIKLLLLLGLFGYASTFLPAGLENLDEDRPYKATQFGAGLIYVMYAFSGWNAISYVTAEVSGGAKTVARVLLLGCTLVTACYLSINFFYFSALTIPELAADPILPVASKTIGATIGEDAGRWFSFAVILSLLSAMSAMVWLGPKIYQRMADDGLAPEFLGQRNPQNVPQFASILQSVWSGLLIVSGTFDQLLIMSGAPLLFFSALSVSCVWRMGRWPKLTVTVAAILFITVSLAGLGMLVVEKPVEVIGGVITVAAGYPLYYLMLYGREHS